MIVLPFTGCPPSADKLKSGFLRLCVVDKQKRKEPFLLDSEGKQITLYIFLSSGREPDSPLSRF